MREALVRDKVFMPDPALRGIYERAIERQQTLYDTMLPWFDPA
jgi:hypothetical protein